MKKYFFYKILKSLKLISKEQYLQQIAKYTRVYKLVSRSKLFDEKWYVGQYPQIQNLGISPLEHFITFGFKEGKNPSKNFDAQKTFAHPCPKYFYALYEKKYAKSYAYEHKSENKIERFLFNQRKILLFSHEFSLSGAPRALLNMAKVLRAQGLEPVFLSPCFGDLENELQKNKFEYYVEPLLMMKLLFQERKTQQFFSSFECIMFNSLGAINYAPYVLSNAKKIAWVHEAAYGFDGQNSTSLTQVFAHIDKIYSVSPYAKTFVDMYVCKDKSKVLTLYIEDIASKIVAAAFGGTNKKFTFSLIGAVSKVKGHDFFIEAIMALPQKMRVECDFKLIGSLGTSKFAKKLQKDFEKEKLICTGELGYTKTLEEMANSDVIVCASRDESLSMVSIEAMMLKKVLLISSTTGVAYYLKDKESAYVFDFTKDNLAELLQKIYEERDNFTYITENAYNVYLENFTQASFSKNVERIFDFLLLE